MCLPEPCLVLDASARKEMFVGVVSGPKWVGQGHSLEGAMEGLFTCTEQALAEAKLKLDEIQSFAVSIGPGSILGIRIASLAVRSWSVLKPRPIFVWDTLTALALTAIDAGKAGPFLVAAESRQRRWHVCEVLAGNTLGTRFEAEAEQINASGIRVLASSPAAQGVLTSLESVPSAWAALPTLFALPGFLHLEPRPDALNLANDFATWSGQRHRADS